MLKRLPSSRAANCVALAGTSPLARPDTTYPAWYLQRWHFLPEGYLSARGASVYETVVRRLYYSLREQSALAVVVGWLREARPAAVAELGCGPGRGVLALATSLPSTRILGADLSPFMLERAWGRTAALPNVRLAHCDVAAALAPEETLDAVVALHLVGHLPSRAASAALATVARALRPGGRLILGDHRWHRHSLPAGFRVRRVTHVAFHLRLMELERTR